MSAYVLDLDDRHAAFLAGYDLGHAEGARRASEDLVLTLLHERAREALGMARRYAAAKGPNWSALIEEAGELDE